MVQQNIAIAVTLAAVGSVLGVMAVLVLAHAEHRKKFDTTPKEYNERGLVMLNVFLQMSAGTVSTVSTWYGPVSVVVPIFTATQLLSNMVMFWMLGIETFSKDVVVGTLVVICGALVLPFVGPTIQQDQDASELILDHDYALLWAGVLMLGSFVPGSLVVRAMRARNNNARVPTSMEEDNNISRRTGSMTNSDSDVSNVDDIIDNETARYDEKSYLKPAVIKTRQMKTVAPERSLYSDFKFIILVLAQVFAVVLSNTICKVLVSVSGYTFVVAVILFFCCSTVTGSVSILCAVEVDQGKFVPATAVGSIILNAVTGLIIWQDWKVVQSWIGYMVILLQMLIGVYLISNIDYFAQSVDNRYALSQTVTIQTAKGLLESRSRDDASVAGASIQQGLAGGNINYMLHRNVSIGTIDENRALIGEKGTRHPSFNSMSWSVTAVC